MIPFQSFVFLSLVGAAFGVGNDWTEPCLDGVCFYDLAASNSGSASGTLKIWGSPDSITDITTAAGWEILDCKEDTLDQDIRLVCSDESKCAHLYRNIGAVGKIARLPDSCGKNAFAHISRAWVPSDQSIPEGVASRLTKRDGTLPEVQALHIDTNFAAKDTQRLDPVYFAIQAANIPGADQLTLPSSSRIKGRDDSTFVDDAVDSVSRLFDFEWDFSKNIKIVDINKSWNVFDQQLTCPNLSGRLKMDVSAQVSAAAAIGVAVEGQLIPPKITDFALIAALNANLNGGINLNGGLTGSISTGKVNLYEVSVPGLSFPGIFTVGPSFRLDAVATASLDVIADLTVGINYAIEEATMVYPPTSKHAIKNGGTFKFVDTPLKLYAVPSVSTNGKVEAHLIPSLNMGVSALSGAASASVFLNIDASAQMNLALQGQAQGEIIIDHPRRALDEVIPADALAPRPALEARAPTPVDLAPQATATGSASFGGCFDIGAGLDIDVGANAKFFTLFDESVKYSLFSRDWELYKKCFSAQTTPRRREFSPLGASPSPRAIAEPAVLNKRLVCPSLNLPPLQPLFDSMITVAAIKQL